MQAPGPCVQDDLSELTQSAASVRCRLLGASQVAAAYNGSAPDSFQGFVATACGGVRRMGGGALRPAVPAQVSWSPLLSSPSRHAVRVALVFIAIQACTKGTPASWAYNAELFELSAPAGRVQTMRTRSGTRMRSCPMWPTVVAFLDICCVPFSPARCRPWLSASPFQVSR